MVKAMGRKSHDDKDFTRRKQVSREGTTGISTAREAALMALVKTETRKSYINLALPAFLKKLPDHEKPLATTMAYGTIQRLNTIDWALGLILNRALETLTPHIRNLLRQAAYQIMYLDNIPRPVAVDEAVKLSYRYGHKGVARLVNAALRRLSSSLEDLPWPDVREDPVRYLALTHSFPPWMVRRWLNRLGMEEATKLVAAYNRIPSLSVRTNFLKITRGELKEIFLGEGVTCHEVNDIPEALRIEPRPGLPMNRRDSFTEGLYTIQGESSMLAARVLHPASGKSLIDLCSAPGGKTTHLAELMGNEGIIVAGDQHRSRLRLVEEAARRLGIEIIRTRVWDARDVHEFEREADYVLCDAPCSGLGVLDRRPDLKWQKSEEMISALSRLQKELLLAASRVVRRGGKLLYSVCSNEPEETGEVVDFLMKENPSLKPAVVTARLDGVSPEETERGVVEFYPHIHGRDGFFIALLQRL